MCSNLFKKTTVYLQTLAKEINLLYFRFLGDFWLYQQKKSNINSSYNEPQMARTR
jgi:hypothetical protein